MLKPDKKPPPHVSRPVPPVPVSPGQSFPDTNYQYKQLQGRIRALHAKLGPVPKVYPNA